MTIMTALLRFLSLILLVNLIVAEEQSCAADGTCESVGVCVDRHEHCEFWADKGECESNQGYMHSQCTRACNLCGKGAPALGLKDVVPDNDDYGVAQEVDGDYLRQIEDAIIDMKSYFRKAREDPETTPTMLEILDNCKNKHESCAFWKVLGECENVSGLSGQGLYRESLCEV
jgi:hypothetical protein